jgi:hypothetical protein
MGIQKPVEFGKQIHTSVDFEHDLSRGQRAMLREHAISEEEFKKMDPVSQREWLDEARDPSYEHMRGYGKK